MKILLLSSHGHRVRFLTDIFQLFNDMDEKCEWNSSKSKHGEIVEAGISEQELVHVEGTVIQYFSFAVKQDPALGSDILKLLKARQFQLSPFEVAVLLSLYKVQRYEGKVFEILKKAVECEYTHDFQKSASPWIDSLKDLVPPTSMSSVMKSVLRRSGKGWEHIMAGFIGFALNLVHIFSKKSTGTKGCHSGEAQGNVGNLVSSSLTSGAASKGISKHIVVFSLQLIERAFRKHESVRNEILGNLFTGVISRDESSPHFVHLLSRIAATCCHDVMDCMAKVKDTLEYISFMSPGTAVNLVRALQPILRTQTSLQDFLHIVLRKSLFNRELDSRLVALECLIFIAETSSPSSAHQQSSTSSQIDPCALKAADSTAIEIISQVRRCMSQQVQLRQKLYDGLLDLLQIKTYLADHVLGILIPHLEAYTVKDSQGAVNQINLQGCVDELSGGINEPIAHLLRAVVGALSVSEGEQITDEDAGCSNIAIARGLMDKIATYLSTSELTDFELDRLSDFERPHILSIAKLLNGTYETMLEYIVLFTQKSSPTWTKRFFDIIEKITLLHDLLRGHSKPTKGRKSCTVSNDERNTLLTCKFSSLLLAVVGDKAPDDCTFDRATCVAIFENLQCMSLVLNTAIKQV
jgi:fanconi anemia group I protein